MIIFIASYMAVLAGIVWIAVHVSKVKEKEQEVRQIQETMMFMQNFYAMLQKKNEAARRYRHDLAKHIRTLEYMLEQTKTKTDTDVDAGLDESGNLSQLCSQYMEELQECYLQQKQERFCENGVINAILHIKKQQCAEQQIAFDINISDAFYSSIPEFEMSALLNNLIDNAIEANQRIADPDKKRIELSIRMEGGQILICLKNKISEGEVVSLETTRKSKKEEHGIGRKVINFVVEKYHGKGEQSVDTKECVFEEKIWLKTA